jgi:hypothetical protein
MMEIETTSVEWLILADAAQVVGGKLYLLGGGWDMLVVAAGATFPIRQTCALAAALRVPWNETNRPCPVEILVQDEDGAAIVYLRTEKEVGRPPGLPRGSSQRVQYALGLDLSLPHPGTYVVIARAAEQERRISLRVNQAGAARP